MVKSPKTRTVLSIFIGSPGDLQQERKIARDVVVRINKRLSRYLGITIELRGWEDTLPGHASRPQSKINEDLKECDIFVGLLWERWGTPPGGDNPYTSGFQEEYNLALEQREEGQMEDIFLFFKEMSDALERDPGEQASQVIAFKKSVEKEREVFYDTFTETGDWRTLFYDILVEYLTKNFIGNTSKEKEKGQETQQAPPRNGNEVVEASHAIKQIYNQLQNPEEKISDNLVLARANLYTNSLIYSDISTDHLLQNREIHYLYENRDKINLETPEIWLIIRTLLADDYQVKAGWYWTDFAESPNDLLAYLAFNDSIKNIRLEALRLLSNTSKETYRDTIYKIVENPESEIREEATEILASFAEKEDLEFLKEIVNTSDDEIAQKAWEGVLEVLAKTDANKAIEWVVDSPDNRRNNVGKHLHGIVTEANSSKVKNLLNTENEAAQLIVIEELGSNLNSKELFEFTQGDNHDLAAAAYLELLSRDTDIDEEQINNSLKEKAEESSNKNLLGLHLNLKGYNKYSRDEVLLELYKKQDKETLKKKMTWYEKTGPIIYEALFDQYYDELNEILRDDIRNNFARIKNKSLRKLKNKYGDMAVDLISKIEEHDQFNTGKFLLSSFRVLKNHAIREDLELAREFIGDPHNSLFTDTILKEVLDIISNFGNEEDVDLVKKVIINTKYSLKEKASAVLLQIDPENKPEHAQFLLQLDENRIQKLVLQYSLLKEKIVTENIVKPLLFNSNAVTRKNALAYLLSTSSDSELEEVLRQYPQDEDFSFYYYDVIGWLDRTLYTTKSISEWYRSKLSESLLGSISNFIDH